MNKKEITYEYIRGLISGEGSFTFSSTYNGDKLPAFMIQVHERDRALIEAVKKKLGLTNRIYTLGPYKSDGHKRGRTIRLIVRDLGSLKNIIIPLFRNKLIGHKATQFEHWIETINNDSSVPASYKILYRLHKKNGFYDRNPSKFDFTN